MLSKSHVGGGISKEYNILMVSESIDAENNCVILLLTILC